MCNASENTVSRALPGLAEKGLIKYKPGLTKGLRKTASEIKRVIPVPKPKASP